MRTLDALTLATGVVTWYWPADLAASRMQPRDYRPPLVCAVSDDTLSVPFGGIIDVAVGTDETVFLLDRQAFMVHRITAAGVTLAPLGRKGEGPAELSQPALVAVDAENRCTVIQDFHARAVCFLPDGRECPAVDAAPLRDGYFMTVYAHAQSARDGRLVVGTIASKRGDTSEHGAIASVSRLGAPHEGGVVRLLSSDVSASDPNIVELPARYRRLAYTGWDVSPSGVFAYADPSGSFSVCIGHPVDEANRRVTLPWSKADDEALRRTIKESGLEADANSVARVVSLVWLDNNYLLVQPVSEWSTPKADIVGTYDVLHVDGQVVGRWTIRCPYDPENDSVFFRRDRLIVVEGGASAIRSSLQASGVFPPSKPDARQIDEVRVCVYRLFEDERAR